MRSPYGLRGSICAHYGWTWDYLMHGIPYAIVKRMAADAPGIDYDNKKEDTMLELSDDNADEILELINRANV